MSATKRILITEDDTLLAKVLAIRLESAGYEVLTAESGVKGLELAKAEDPDLIISDIGMPLGAGFAMAYRLKQLALGIPIIFMTASKKPGLKRQAMDFGAAAFLEKPYAPEALLEAVARVFEQPKSPKPAPTPAPKEPPPSDARLRSETKKILVVEDDHNVALALAARLEAAGYEASIASDALTGVNCAIKLQPNLIILDITLPAGSGFDVAERVRSLVPRFVPIIFLTASKEAGLRQQAIKLGAANFIEKPYNGDELLVAVRAALGETVSSHADDTIEESFVACPVL